MAVQRPRFDWFQTEELVTLTVMKKGVSLSDCKVTFRDGLMTVYAGEDIIFQASLHSTVDETNFTVTCTPAKVEVRMPKTTAGRWPQLVRSEESKPQPTASSSTKKNWTALEKEVEQEEENETLEGDAAVNKMFRKIYKDASDDVRKAMMKSYSESGGTVLSTNWDEIKNKKTEIKPPDCMEYKKFEQ